MKASAWAWVIGAVVAIGAQAAPNNDRIQPIRAFDLATIESLGRRIHEQDDYAAQATDALVAKIGAISGFTKQGIRGWIVQNDEAGVLVRFIKGTEAEPAAAYDIRFALGRIPFVSIPSSPELTLDQTILYRARQLGIHNISEMCSPGYNTVVLPDPDGDGLLVYALASTTNSDVIPIGGHYRFTVSSDGSRIEQVDRLFASCFTLPKRSSDLSEGCELAAYYMTHVVSDTPVETHVFLQLQLGKPFFVLTKSNVVWKIENGVISHSDTSAAPSGTPAAGQDETTEEDVNP